jgi:hypothetical protein
MQSDLIEAPASDVEALVDQYNSTLSAILEKHAPMIRKEVIIRPKSPWYTDDIRSAKQAKRKVERMWRKTKLAVHLDILKNARVDVKMKCSAAKKQYYMNKISEADNKQKELFSVSKPCCTGKNAPSFLLMIMNKIWLTNLPLSSQRKLKKYAHH